MGTRVFLVDGTYELFRHHYGVPKSTDEQGRPHGAIRGLVRSLQALIKNDRPDYLACAFDTQIESFRNALFDGYKDGTGIDEELLVQFERAEEAVRALGIPVWSMFEFEADDALATGAQHFAQDPSVEQIILCSPDKDLAQCVSGTRIVMYDRRRKQLIDEAGVLEKWGVAPHSIPDWLALVGDAADGIPGVPRWGAKSSATVLARYATIDQIPLDLEAWDIQVRGAKGLIENLQNAYEDALLYKQLATLRTDVPLEYSPYNASV